MKTAPTFTPEALAPLSSMRPRVKQLCSVLALSLALGACASNANVQSARVNAPDAPLTDLAWAAAERGDYYAAIPIFRRAHRADSGDAEPLYGLGKTLMAVGQYADAVQVLQKAVNNDSSHGASYQALGQALLMLGDYTGAVEAMRSAVANQGRRASTVAALGIALDAYGSHDEAVQMLREARSTSPDDLDILSNLGLSLALHGNVDESIEILEEAVRDGRSKAKHRQNLALAYALADEFDKAVAMASIDLDYRSVQANITFIDMIRALPAQQRMATLLRASVNTKRTTDGHAFRGKTVENETTRATLARLLPDQRAEDMSMQVAQVEEDVDPVGLGGVPPLLEPTGWAVQIAAYRKIEHLAPGWTYLSTKYAHIIGGLEPRRSEVDHPPSDRGPVGFFYRLNAGPLTSKEEAVAVCNQMQAEGGECWVRPPEPAEGKLPQDPAAEQDFISSADHDAVMNQVALDVIKQASPAPEQMVAETTVEEVEVEAREDVAEVTAPDSLQVETREGVAEIVSPVAMTVEANDGVREITPATSTMVAATEDADEEELIVFGGDENEITRDTPTVDTLAADETPKEVLPANFGTDGVINLSKKDEESSVNVISAFEEAEKSLFEEAVVGFPSELEEPPLEETGSEDEEGQH